MRFSGFVAGVVIVLGLLSGCSGGGSGYVGGGEYSDPAWMVEARMENEAYVNELFQCYVDA